MMDSEPSPIRAELGPDGVLLVTIDMAGRTMNVFSRPLMDALEETMDRVDADPAVEAVVVTSGKPTFLAGADLVMVQGFCDAARTDTPEQMLALCGHLGRLFVRLEASPKPWVAAVNGLALGGGLELALACRQRLVADDPRLQLGVPEVRWGLLPGAGGTQRLPRMAGFERAMGMLLSGQSITPAQALAWNIATAVVPREALLARAREAALALRGRPYRPEDKFADLAQDDVPAHSDEEARVIAWRHGVGDDDFARYPAYRAIVDAVLKGARLPLAEAGDVEMRQFLRLMVSPVAGRMVRTLFLGRLHVEKTQAAPDGLRLERVVHGPISQGRSNWHAALGRARLPVTCDTHLPVDHLELRDSSGTTHRLVARELEHAAAVAPCLVLAPAGPYGQVLEIVGVPPAAADAAAALAARLGCLPWRTAGPRSLLQRLHHRPLHEQAALARSLGRSEDLALDVAACLAGVSPAWSGGPLLFASEPATA